MNTVQTIAVAALEVWGAFLIGCTIAVLGARWFVRRKVRALVADAEIATAAAVIQDRWDDRLDVYGDDVMDIADAVQGPSCCERTEFERSAARARAQARTDQIEAAARGWAKPELPTYVGEPVGTERFSLRELEDFRTWDTEWTKK